VTSDPNFKVTTFLKSNIGKTARLKDKVTIAQDEKSLTYGMVLCLMTLTDLSVRCVGLSASAELLVLMAFMHVYSWQSTNAGSLWQLQLSMNAFGSSDVLASTAGIV